MRGWKIMTSAIMSYSELFVLGGDLIHCLLRLALPKKPQKTASPIFRSTIAGSVRHKTPPLRIILLSLYRQRHKVVTLVHTSTIATRAVCSVARSSVSTLRAAQQQHGEERSKKNDKEYSFRFSIPFTKYANNIKYNNLNA